MCVDAQARRRDFPERLARRSQRDGDIGVVLLEAADLLIAVRARISGKRNQRRDRPIVKFQRGHHRGPEIKKPAESRVLKAG